MTNKELIDMLVVTHTIDFSIYSLNLDIIASYIDSDEIWRPKDTIKYAKDICKLCGLENESEYVSVIIEKELKNGTPIFAKTLYNTLVLDKNYRIDNYESTKELIRSKLKDNSTMYEIYAYLKNYWLHVMNKLLGLNLWKDYVHYVDSAFLMRFSDNECVICHKTIKRFNNGGVMTDTREKLVDFKTFNAINWGKVKSINIHDYDIMV